MWPLEVVSAALMLNVTILLLAGVISRYVFGKPLVWSDEVVSISFVWLTMLGAAIALYRNEHLRLNLFVDMLPERPREFVHAFALVAIAALLLVLLKPAYEYMQDEWFIRTPALDMPNAFRVASIGFGFLAMLGMILLYAARTVRKADLALAACWWPPLQVRAGCSRPS
jgi:TRAP-type C4-dicarboxylate transport system permease small subunit